MRGLPDHQGAEMGPCGLALTTRVAGGVLVDYPCGFQSFRPGGERCAPWPLPDVETFIARSLHKVTAL